MRDYDQATQQTTQQDLRTLKQQVPGGVTAAEPDEHWSMELEKRHKEACAQIELHSRELARWQRMGRAVKAALAALHEPQPEQSPEYDQSTEGEY